MNTIQLASRTLILQPSPTLAINAKAARLKEEGLDIVSLGAGEPDFNTPQLICNAAIEALHQGITKYTPTSGIKQLKEIFCEKLRKENHLHVTPDQIVVSTGAKQCLFNSIMSLINPGDEVILIAPYWATYSDQVVLAGGIPVVVQTDISTYFIPTYEQIKEKITSQTKAIIINTPNNPTGAVWPRSILKEIAALAIKHNFWIIADEIYEKLIYQGEHQSIAALGSEVAERTVTINGCSKTFAMTGWRIGFSASPKILAQKFSDLQDQVTSCANSFSQMGAIAAYQLSEDVIINMRKEFLERRNLMMELLKKIPGLKVHVPQGAFYVFPEIKYYFNDKIGDDFEFANQLLEKALVAVVPGAIFSSKGYIRLSYATSRENIQSGVTRIANFLEYLS